MTSNSERDRLVYKANLLGEGIKEIVYDALKIREEHAERIDRLSKHVEALESELQQVGWQMKAAVENEKLARQALAEKEELVRLLLERQQQK